jgi:sulfoxide reductase heme-binding subunit YedZ
MLTFTVVDYGLDWGLILNAIKEKKYILVGVTAFVLLIPLALTSTKGWQRRLGRRWRPLHNLVYLAVPLAVLHFYLLVKADVREPLRYAAWTAILVGVRVPVVRRWLTSLRVRLLSRRAAH